MIILYVNSNLILDIKKCVYGYGDQVCIPMERDDSNIILDIKRCVDVRALV